MTIPQVTIAPGIGPEREIAVFVCGVQLRGVLQVVAHPTAAAMILIDPANVWIDPALAPPAAAAEPVRLSYPTDGAA